jgi:hypothetical protein
MRYTVYRIQNLVETFQQVGDGSGHKGVVRYIDDVERAPGSGLPVDLIAHQQGMCRLDGEGSFVVCGSAKDNPGYFYLANNWKGYYGNNGHDWWPIDDVMTHAGGLQVAGTLLVTGNEQYNGITTRGDRSNVRFYDIGDPNNVMELRHLLIERRGDGRIASACGLTIIGEQWLLAIRAKETMDFYSLIGDPWDPSKTFNMIGSLNLKTHGMKEYQNISLYIDQNWIAYLFGMPDGESNKDEVWLYQVDGPVSGGQIPVYQEVTGVTLRDQAHFYTKTDDTHFKYAASVWFVPTEPGNLGDLKSGHFYVYASSMHVDDRKITLNEWADDY